MGCGIMNSITAEKARKNIKRHEKAVKRRQKEYIKTLCKEIKIASNYGGSSITTCDTLDKIMTREFMNEIRKYFEQRGFFVTEEKYLTCWLRISWQ